MSDIGQLERNKDKFLEYKTYFENEIARKSKHINHTDDQCHFVRYTVSELFQKKQNELRSPFLGLETPSMRIKNNDHHNVQAVWRGAIVIGHSFEKGNTKDRDAALDKCFFIFLKIIAKIHKDTRALRLVKFDLDNLQANPVLELFGDDRVGVRWEFEMNSQFDLGYYEQDWLDVDEATPQPPLATVTDGGTEIELYQGDSYTCTIPSTDDGQFVLKNSAGTVLATYTVPPGSEEEGTAPDGDMRINSTDIGAAGKVPSGGENNLRVVNSDDDEKGHLNGNGHWQFVDSIVSNLAGTWETDFPSGTTHSLALGKIKDKDGNDVPVDYLPASLGYMYESDPCPAIPTLTIAVTNADGDPITMAGFDETITITATTDLVADSFYLYIDDGTNALVAIEGVTGEFEWDVSFYGAISIQVVAVNDTLGVAASEPFVLTNSELFPPSISDCVLWINAALESIYSLSGSEVVQQDDLSGLSNDLTSSVGQRPTYLEEPDGVNGLRGVQYASGKYMMAAGLSLDIVSGNSVFIVVMFKSSVTGDVYSNGNTHNSSQPYTLLKQEGLNVRVYDRVGSSALYPIALDVPYVFANHRTPTEEVFLINGVVQHTRVTNTNGERGNFYVNSGFFGQTTAIIEDIVIHNRNLSSLEKSAIESYLISKWNIV